MRQKECLKNNFISTYIKQLILPNKFIETDLSYEFEISELSIIYRNSNQNKTIHRAINLIVFVTQIY